MNESKFGWKELEIAVNRSLHIAEDTVFENDEVKQLTLEHNNCIEKKIEILEKIRENT